MIWNKKNSKLLYHQKNKKKINFYTFQSFEVVKFFNFNFYRYKIAILSQTKLDLKKIKDKWISFFLSTLINVGSLIFKETLQQHAAAFFVLIIIIITIIIIKDAIVDRLLRFQTYILSTITSNFVGSLKTYFK